MPRTPLDAGAPPQVAPAVAFSDDPSEREYDADGLYAIGPKRARDPLARLIADTICPVTPLSPAKARYEQGAARRTRLRRLAMAVQGHRTVNRPKRAA